MKEICVGEPKHFIFTFNIFFPLYSISILIHSQQRKHVFVVTYFTKQFFVSISFSMNLLFCYHLVGILNETFTEESFLFHF